MTRCKEKSGGTMACVKKDDDRSNESRSLPGGYFRERNSAELSSDHVTSSNPSVRLRARRM